MLHAPHRHIEQVIDCPLSLAMLDADDPRADKKEQARRAATSERAV
jgi:hypothetical protein